MKNVSFGVLENGLRYYAQCDRVSAVSGIGMIGGSIHDPPGKSGMAHLAEHVLCRRSRTHDSKTVDLVLEKYMGGPDACINVRIDRSSTFFGHGDLLRQSYMFESFEMFSRMLRDQLISTEDLEVEKAAVHQEYYLRGLDEMNNLVDDLMHQVLYEKNPARRRIDCEPVELETISLSQLKYFIKRHYVPRNMFVVMLGPSHREVAEAAKKQFSDWDLNKSKPELDYDGTDDVPCLNQIRSLEVERSGIHQYHWGIGFPTESFNSEDAEVIDVLSRIWAFRLRTALREKNRSFHKGVYRALSYTPRTFCHGLLYVWFATKDQDFAKQAEEVVLQECENLKKSLVSEEEFDAMVHNLSSDFAYAFRQGPEQLSELIIASVCNGDEDLIRLHTIGQRIKKVTRRKILAVANKYFTKKYASVLIKPV